MRYHWLRAWAERDSVGVFGPLGVVERARGSGLGTVLARAALYSLRERGYRRALIPIVRPDLVSFYERAADARLVETVDLDRGGRRARAVVLASGNGSNFQAVAEAAAARELPLEIVDLGIPTTLVTWERASESREAYDARVLAAVAAYAPELVLLLGWMHVLPATFVARFPESLNVHPAFLPLDPAADAVTMPDFTSLPAFRGARAFDDALAAGSRWAGASVHRVGVAVDRGVVFARAPLAIAPGEPRAELDERLHALERRVVRSAIARWSWERR